MRQQRAWEWLNLACFVGVAALASNVCAAVIREKELVALQGFFRVDALSALILAVTAFVALATSIYAIGYFRKDEQDGRITRAQLRRYYVLTPLFVAAMLFVPLADNLGI